MADNRYCVVMCGGAGTRFWPFSRESRPKQFIDFFGTGQTLLQLTVDRIRRFVPDRNIIILTNAQYSETVCRQLPYISPEHILLEPARRDTAPAILWAAHHIAARNPEASFVTLPSDHLILKEGAFHEALLRGFEFVEGNGGLLAIGATPTAPATGRCYIQKDARASTGENIYKIRTFADRPGERMAEVFVNSGEFVWNTGIFLWKAAALIEAFSRYDHDTAMLFDADASVYAGEGEAAFVEEVFPKAGSSSIDWAVMEKASDAYLLQANFGWSDMGTWRSLHSVSPKNQDGNVTQNCRALLYDSHDCIVASETDRLIVASGLKGYIVADTPNALLICPIEAEQKIRNIVNDVRARYGDSYI
ncbi:MAG: NTP transferase domain-containing protein [Muribaculaceae bacterium]|nr:NTP transferase domain-containing protein [Muribaculaceae bacterium]